MHLRSGLNRVSNSFSCYLCIRICVCPWCCGPRHRWPGCFSPGSLSRCLGQSHSLSPQQRPAQGQGPPLSGNCYHQHSVNSTMKKAHSKCIAYSRSQNTWMSSGRERESERDKGINKRGEGERDRERNESERGRQRRESSHLYEFQYKVCVFAVEFSGQPVQTAPQPLLVNSHQPLTLLI